MKTTLNTLFCLAALLAIPAFAPADIMTYNGVGLNETVTTHAYDAGGNPLLANNLTVYAGQEKITYEGKDYNAYCVDLNQYAATGDMTQQSIYTLNNSWRVAYLFNTYAGTVSTNLDAAALGVAIWEMVAEPTNGPFSLDANSSSRGRFWITGNDALETAAANLINSIPASYSSPNMPIVLHSDVNQDFLIGYNTNVPEPATMALMGLGGVAVVLRRRRLTA